MSFRKSLGESSALRPVSEFKALLAYFSNSKSCVNPRSSVIRSYFVRRGNLRIVLGSPPSLCSIAAEAAVSMRIRF